MHAHTPFPSCLTLWLTTYLLTLRMQVLTMEELAMHMQRGIGFCDLRLCELHADFYHSSRGAVHPLSSAVVELTTSIARSLVLRPVKTFVNGGWLLPDYLDHRRAGSRACVCNPVAAVREVLPRVVKRLLSLAAGTIVVAGGRVFGALAVGAAPGADIDLFVVARDVACALSVLLHANDVLGGLPEFVSLRAVTYHINDTELGMCVVQVVLIAFESAGAVINGFDVPPSQAMLTCVPTGGDLLLGYTQSVYVTAAWLACVEFGAFPLLLSAWQHASPVRAWKYYGKGKRVLGGVLGLGFRCGRFYGVRFWG
jgi:hypothetical protein